MEIATVLIGEVADSEAIFEDVDVTRDLVEATDDSDGVGVEMLKYCGRSCVVVVVAVLLDELLPVFGEVAVAGGVERLGRFGAPWTMSSPAPDL